MRWKLLEPVPDDAYQAFPAMPRAVAALLWRRGIRSSEEAGRFLEPSWERDVHDPFLFRDMAKAVSRVLRAVREKERVVVHGDYDADGVSGSVILSSVLRELGAELAVHIPHREKDGYGMNPEAVRRLAAEGAKVIITTDCGISNGAEIALANELGMDVIVTDHHSLPPELPPAHAILHPHRDGETYPFRHLTGGGVAFKLAQALWREAGLEAGGEKRLLDMVAISTVADLGRLEGENRAFVRFGLQILGMTRRKGLLELLRAARLEGKRLNADSIGFQLAPRINAAGRMDHARHAFDLLMAESSEEAAAGAARLEGYNLERRGETERIAAEALRLAASEPEASALVIRGDSWPAALCGLVASRLVDRYHRPAVVLGRGEDGRHVGSGRSIRGFDITSALREGREHLLKFGGHPAACGLTIEGDAAFEAFRTRFLSVAAERLADVELDPVLEIEEAVGVEEISLGLVEDLLRLEPFGEGNPRPRFLLRGARVAAASRVGRDGSHLKLSVVGDRGGRLGLIAFGFGERAAEAAVGGRIDAVLELSVNEWNGSRSPQGAVVDLRPAREHVVV